MTTAAEFLLHIRRVIRLYESLNRQVCDTWHITQIETDIIAFLKNNPEKDTARDIVEFRMLQKGNVSQAVEDLIQKGFLARRPDERDRRRIHLSLTERALPIAADIGRVRGEFLDRLFAGFTPGERRMYQELNQKLFANAALAEAEESKERK